MPSERSIKHNVCGVEAIYTLSDKVIHSDNPRIKCSHCDKQFRVPKKVIESIIPPLNQGGDSHAPPNLIPYDGDDNKLIHDRLVSMVQTTDDIRAIQTLMSFNEKTGQLKDYKTKDKEEMYQSFKLMDFKALSQLNKHLTSTSLGNLSVDELKEKLLTFKTS